MTEQYRGPDWVILGFSALTLALTVGAMAKTKLEQEKPPTTPITGESRPATAPKPSPPTPEAKVVFSTVTPTPSPTLEPTPTPTPSPTPPLTQKG